MLKTLINRTLRSIGLELRKAQRSDPEFRMLVRLLRERAVDCVLDVGANKGQFAQKLFAAGYAGTIISFEPMPDVHAELAARAKAHPRWIVAPALALSDRAGTAEFHVANNSISSSLLPMADLHLKASPHSFEVANIEVELATLDAVLPTLGGFQRYFLKMDTQGTEKDIIEGALASMERIVGIVVELSYKTLYEGQPLFNDMFWRIDALGFRLAGLFDVYRKGDELYCSDGIFMRPLPGSPSS